MCWVAGARSCQAVGPGRGLGFILPAVGNLQRVSVAGLEAETGKREMAGSEAGAGTGHVAWGSGSEEAGMGPQCLG